MFVQNLPKQRLTEDITMEEPEAVFKKLRQHEVPGEDKWITAF